MPDITFECPHCSQVLEAPEDMVGQQIECPACNGGIEIPGPEEEEAPSGEKSGGKQWRLPRKKQRGGGARAGMEGETCPGCGAELEPDAVLCVQCGLNLKTGKHIKTSLDE